MAKSVRSGNVDKASMVRMSGIWGRLRMAICALCLVSAVIASHRLYLSGSVHFKTDEKQQVQGLVLIVKASGQVVASATVNEKGRYAIDFVPEDRSSFDFYYAGLGHDTTFIRSFTRFDSDVMAWDIEL